jgi:hypothetical protein
LWTAAPTAPASGDAEPKKGIVQTILSITPWGESSSVVSSSGGGQSAAGASSKGSELVRSGLSLPGWCCKKPSQACTEEPVDAQTCLGKGGKIFNLKEEVCSRLCKRLQP